MKKGKKALVATALFVAAMNLNGCVYGAPPEHDVDSNNRNQTADVQMEDDASQNGVSQDDASQDDADASK